MNAFNFKRRNVLSGPHFVGSLFIIAGLFALLSPLFFSIETSIKRVIGVGMGAVILGLLIITAYGGTAIDFTENRFKEYVTIAGYRMGEWTTLPNIIKIKIISVSKLETNKPNGISPTLSGKVTDFKILLYANASEPMLSFIYSNQDTAIKDAKMLSSQLNADLILAISEKA